MTVKNKIRLFCFERKAMMPIFRGLRLGILHREVASFNRWKQLGRQVRRGEKARDR